MEGAESVALPRFSVAVVLRWIVVSGRLSHLIYEDLDLLHRVGRRGRRKFCASPPVRGDSVTDADCSIDSSRHQRTVDLAEQRLAHLTRPARSPEDAAVDGERARRVLAAVAELPHPQRDAIALRYSTDLPVREIAALIGKGEAATQKLIGRGLDRLKEMLDDLA